MTSEELQELRRRVKDATPGPYHLAPCSDGLEIVDNEDGSTMATVYGDDEDDLCWPVSANAALLAAGPELLEHITEMELTNRLLREENAVYWKALKRAGVGKEFKVKV